MITEGKNCMRNQMTKKPAILSGILCILCALCLALGIAFASNARIASASADAAEEGGNVLYEQDFSSSLEGDIANNIAVSDGAGTITSNQSFNLPLTQMAASNNYSVAFDLKLTGTTEVYVHFVGLDGTNNSNIYLRIVGQGAYLCITDNFGHDIYNNTGDLHGGLDATRVSLDDFAHFELVHFEGYLELWVNGTRRCVSHLCDFGNNNYMSRSPIEEGTITAIALHAQNANAAVVDNIRVTEPTGAATSYSETNADITTSSSKTFPLSALNLYRENFLAEASFVITDETASGYYPTIKLYGLNASLRSNNQKEYAVNVQALVNGTSFQPQIMWQPEDPETAWDGVTGAEVTVAQGQTVTMRVEVYGDHFDLYVNGEISVSTTFTEMGLEEGRVQYIRVQSGNGGAAWTQFSYAGYEAESAVSVTADETTVMAGESVTLRADFFGTRGENFVWYVNDEAQPEESTTLTLSDLTPGTYTVQYKNDTLASDKIVVTVVDKMITLTSDTTQIYPTEEIVITAQLQGDFAGETLTWYVNGEAQEEQGTTLTLSNLAAGTYTVQYNSANVESNEFTFTVLESSVEVTTEKNSYFVGEKAVFEAELAGLSDEEVIEWYVDGTKQEGVTGASFELDLSDAEAGSKIVVYAQTVSGVKSNEVTIGIAFDVMASIKENEFYKTIYEDVIEEDGTYGNFSVGKDESGELYLYSEVSSNSTYYTMNAKMPTNVQYLFEYELYIPADISTTNYVYPCLAGLNSKYPAGMVEIAWEVNAEGVRPYVKDQSTGKEYLHTDYGFGLDLTYEGGTAKKGDWNTITVAVSGNYISTYINGEMALFFEMIGATVPSGASFNLFPDGGVGVVPVRIRNISFSGIVEPAPDLVSVTVSLSSVSMQAGGTVTATAMLNPFNAEANAISWYVNGTKVEGANELTYSFTTETAGEYRISCEIDGIRSAEKTVTVNAADGGNAGGGDTTNGGGNTGLWIGIGVAAGVIVIAAAVTAVLVIRKKKNNNG